MQRPSHHLPVSPTRSESTAGRGWVITFVEDQTRSLVNAVAEGAFRPLHAESLDEALDAFTDRPARVLLIEPQLLSGESLPAIQQFRQRAAGTVAVVQSGEVRESPQHFMTLGAHGITESFDLGTKEDCSQLRRLAAEMHPDVRQRIRTSVVRSLDNALAGTQRFFDLLILEAPHTTDVRTFAKRAKVEASTLTSRFLRAGLPSPKRYLAGIRLIYAAAFFETKNWSITRVANHLDYSSPQSFSRHVRTTMRMTGSEFRQRFSFDRAIEGYVEELIAPYVSVFTSFDPFRASPV